jgi:hypothetical protein
MNDMLLLLFIFLLLRAAKYITEVKERTDIHFGLLGDEGKRKTMGDFGRDRVVNELEWNYEAPKLLKAYDALFSL